MQGAFSAALGRGPRPWGVIEVPARVMHYALEIGLRHLRSRKKQTVSVITFVAVAGVALGVAALLAVLSITTGFEQEFRNKVLGVNAHVLVMKYGLDFEEYGDVIARATEMPEVAGAAPFLIKEMLLVHGDRISSVLVKGIDPELMPSVLDLPDQMVEGTLEGLRREGAEPPRRPEDREDDAPRQGLDLDEFLHNLERYAAGAPVPGSEDAPPEVPAPQEPAPEVDAPELAVDEPSGAEGEGDPYDDYVPLPTVSVPTPAEAEAALRGGVAAPFDADEDVVDDLWVDHGSGAADEDLSGIVLGRALATRLQVGVGERVTVVSPRSGLDTSMFQTESHTPRSKEFMVIGIFEAGFEEYDTRLVYVDLYEAQRFFDHGDSVDGVEIRLHDTEQAPMVSRRLERLLGGGPYHTMDWQELNHNLFTALEIQKIMLSLVIATIIFVAAFNVIATLIMIVLEKKREIAILKAMGAHDMHILGVFVIQGLIIGLIGTAIGLLLGGGVCLWLEAYRFPLDPHVYLIDHLPLRTSALEFATTVVIALMICLIATLIPSWWAARSLPADGVRHE